MRGYRKSERGAVLIHVGVALIGLLAFSALSIDYGVLWVSRGQAQNSADAAALAAAVSLAFGDPDDKDRARAVAVAAAQQNAVWGQAPSVAAADVTFPLPCPPGAPGLPDLCVRVDVFRNQGRGPLPTFFAQLVGVTEQGVRATATAQVAAGTTTRCVRPWAVPDKWIDRIDTPQDNRWTIEDTFDRFHETGNKKGQLLSTDLGTLDEYVPDGASPGSGFQVPDDVGMRVRLKPGHPRDTVSAGWFLPLALGGTGGNTYQENIESCNGVPFQVGDVIGTEEGIEVEPGNMIGPTKHGVDALVAQDPNAVWSCDGVSAAPTNLDCAGTVINSAFGTSPRVVPVPLFDVQNYLEQKYEGGTEKTTGRFNLRITRLVGFFIEGRQGNDVVGRFTYYPAEGIGNNTLPEDSNFLRTILLVR